MSTTLIVHAGGIRRTREELADLHTPEATSTWRPVPHARLVNELIHGLHRHGVEVVRDDYCTMGRDDAKLFGVMDLAIPDLDTADFRMALGLRGANDRSMAIQVIAAARVFVCDNLAMHGDHGGVFLKKKHTARLDLSKVVPEAVDRFLDKTEILRADIDRMRNQFISDAKAKEIIFDAFSSMVMPLRFLPEVANLYFDCEEQRDKFPDRSLWSLNNAFTEAVKQLQLVSQHNASQRIGRLFGRVLHKKRPEAVAVIDGLEVV